MSSRNRWPARSSPAHREEDLDRVHQGSRSPTSRSARLTRSPSPTRSARYSLHDSAETSSPDNILPEFHARSSNVALRGVHQFRHVLHRRAHRTQARHVLQQPLHPALCSKQRVMFMMVLPSRSEMPFCCGVWGAVKVCTTPVVLQ